MIKKMDALEDHFIETALQFVNGMLDPDLDRDGVMYHWSLLIYSFTAAFKTLMDIDDVKERTNRLNQLKDDLERHKLGTYGGSTPTGSA